MERMYNPSQMLSIFSILVLFCILDAPPLNAAATSRWRSVADMQWLGSLLLLLGDALRNGLEEGKTSSMALQLIISSSEIIILHAHPIG